MGRIRLLVALDCTGYSLETFMVDNIQPIAVVATDLCSGCGIIDKEQFEYEKTYQHKSRSVKTYMVCISIRP
jgi:hypothetical protein